MSARELAVWIAGAEAGRIECDREGRLRFEYGEAWRSLDDAIFLSLSMPLARAAHPHDVIHPFLERIGARLVREGLDRPVVERLVDALSGHARRCAKALAARGS